MGMALWLAAALAASAPEAAEPPARTGAPTAATLPAPESTPSPRAAGDAPAARPTEEVPKAPVPAAAAAPAPSPAPAPCAAELFRIGRSTNANEVVYAARLAPNGGLDADDPLKAEWHMLAEDGHREGLNFLENLVAYGFSVDEVPGGGAFIVVLKAKKDRPVRLSLQDGCPVALVTIAGKTAFLRRIFVQTASGGLIPEVAYADIEGVDASSGAKLHERIVPAPRSPARGRGSEGARRGAATGG